MGIRINSEAYLGKDVIAGNGENQYADVPNGVDSFWVEAEGGDVHIEINGVAAAATAGSRVPQDSIRLYTYNNVTSLGVFCAEGTTARIRFEG